MAKSKDGECGHINRHFIPSAGVDVKELLCTLPAGHAPVSVRREALGEDKRLHEIYTQEVIHQAPYTMIKRGTKKEAIASWSDDAGTERPARG